MSSEKPYFIGLMSGTSLDAIDAALVDFSSSQPHLVATVNTPIPEQLRQEIVALCSPGDNEILRMGRTDHQLANLFAESCQKLLASTEIEASQVQAIGSHGQTIRHEPDLNTPFTLQIGNPNIIAQLTGITTVADFRRRDMAAGGQGAPLAPSFHAALFHSCSVDRAILNIGGMANLTLLPRDSSQAATGFDTGPGNVLIDYWCQLHLGQPFDLDGEWARSGNIEEGLLQQMLSDTYFKAPPPKSTGRELFNNKWLENQINRYSKPVSPEDMATTLAELTARTISHDLQTQLAHCKELYVCGGGTHNHFLMERLTNLNPNCQVFTTDSLGAPPDWVEAIAFAWLAKQTLERNASNLPAVTGASEPCILGGVYYS